MLTRWEPFGSLRRRRRGDVFSELNTMQQEMNQLFDEFFGERRGEMGEARWLPAVDVSEKDSEIVVNAELPGMTQDDIEINLEDGRLTLQGEKKQEKKEEKENYHSIERSYGKFSRSVMLPAGVDAENVQATFKNGILKITMPKTEESKPKKISISAGS